MKLAALVVAILLGAPALAVADTTIHPPSGPVVVVDAAPRPHPGKQGLRRVLVQRFDRDGDGRLDRQERRALVKTLRRISARMEGKAQRGPRGPRRGDMVQRYDRDGDGNLGPGELPPRAMRRMQRLDKNGDGWVSPEERPQRRQRVQ